MGDVNPSWQSEGTNYTADFTTKSISEARRTRCRPTSGGRKNNPQPLHLAHLRRIHNQVSYNDVVSKGSKSKAKDISYLSKIKGTIHDL